MSNEQKNLLDTDQQVEIVNLTGERLYLLTGDDAGRWVEPSGTALKADIQYSERTGTLNGLQVYSRARAITTGEIPQPRDGVVYIVPSLFFATEQVRNRDDVFYTSQAEPWRRYDDETDTWYEIQQLESQNSKPKGVVLGE